jgi:hypothetical protein
MADDILIQPNEMSEVTVASSSKCQLDQLFGPLSFQSDYICCSGIFFITGTIILHTVYLTKTHKGVIQR